MFFVTKGGKSGCISSGISRTRWCSTLSYKLNTPGQQGRGAACHHARPHTSAHAQVSAVDYSL